MSHFCSFSWQLDSSLWQQVKEAKNEEIFTSNIFSAANCEFYLKFYPNGNAKESDGKAELFCQLIRMPWNIHAVSFQQTLIARNMAYRHAYDCLKSKAGDSYGWAKDLNKEIQLLNEEIFDCEIQLLAIYTSESHEIPVSEWQKYIGPQAKKNTIACFEWKILPQLWKSFISSETNQSFASHTFSRFNSKWYLDVCPSGYGSNSGWFAVFLHLLPLSFPNTIEKIECLMMAEIPELNIRHSFQINLSLSNANNGLFMQMPSSRMESVEQATILLTIDIFKIWDSETKNEVQREEWFMYIGYEHTLKMKTDINVNDNINNNSGSNVLNLKEEKKEDLGIEHDMQLHSYVNDRLSNIETKIAAMKLNADFMKLNVESLTMQVKQLLFNNSVDNKNKSSIEIFSQWLNSIGMSEYLVAFVSNGFDEMDLVCELSDHELLHDIGIKKKGHRIKLLRALKELQLNNEGKDRSNNNNKNAKVAMETNYI